MKPSHLLNLLSSSEDHLIILKSLNDSESFQQCNFEHSAFYYRDLIRTRSDAEILGNFTRKYFENFTMTLSKGFIYFLVRFYYLNLRAKVQPLV